MVARLYGQTRRQARANTSVVLDQLGLADAADRPVSTYSGGMRRRLDLGASLVGAPRLLLLDEPTTGLDPRSRNELWEAIRGMVAAGTDVLLTTQYLDEADQLAQRIVIVDKGRVIADGTPDELKSRAGRDVVEIRVRPAGDLTVVAEALGRLGTEAPRTDAGTGRVTIPVDGGRAVIAEAVRALDALAVEVDDIGLRRPTLDEVFLTLTGSPIDADDDAESRPPTSDRRPPPTSGSPLGRLRSTPMTIVTFDAGQITPATRPAGAFTAAAAVAGRSVRKFVRTPQLLVISTITGAMFLLIFRYVFGGAIDAGPVSYVTFMVPGYIVTSVLFTGSNASSSVAQDMEEGFTDRLKSLPVSRTAVLAGRVVAETALLALGLAATAAIGVAVGFRPQGTIVEALAAFGLTLVFGFAFMWVFVWLGLVAGNVQAAQGMSLLIFPLSFVSSAMVPVDSMPGWLQPVAEHQPITVMTNAVRSLALGDPSLAGLGGSTGHYVTPGAGVGGRHGGGVRPAGGAAVPQGLSRRAVRGAAAPPTRRRAPRGPGSAIRARGARSGRRSG